MKAVICLSVILFTTLGPAGIGLLPKAADSVEARIALAAAEIVDSPYERAFCIDPATGAVRAAVTGGPGAVRLPGGRACYGAIIIHNHPAGGANLSLEDVAAAELYNARQLIAVSRQGRGVMACRLTRPPDRLYYGIGLNLAAKGSDLAGPVSLGLYNTMRARIARMGAFWAISELLTTYGINYECKYRG